MEQEIQIAAENNLKPKQVPELRFGEFEKDWKEIQLGELGKFKGGGTPDTTIEKYWNGEIPWISSSDIIENDIHQIKINRWINIDAIANTATKIIPKGSILLISRVGVGKLAINNEDICTSQDFSNFIPRNDNSFYIGYYLIANKNLLLAFAQGTSIKGFTTSDIKSLKVKIPILGEQQKIASFLSEVDKKIQQLTRKKELLERNKKGLMQKLFSQELRFKNEDGNDFLEWDVKMLNQICEVNPKNEVLPASFIYIDLESVNNGRLVKHNRITSGEAPSRAQRILEKNDVLFQTVRPYQMNNLFFEQIGDFIASTGYAQLRVKENPKYLYQLIHTSKFVAQVMKRCTGTSYPAISSSDLANIKVPVPCEKEQKKIADFLSGIDLKIESVSQQITQTQNFKKGLLQQMFI